MTASSESDWATANQVSLSLALTELKAKLRRHARRADAAAMPSEQCERNHESEAVDALGGSLALEHVAKAFCLSPFERDILLLCAGVELDREFAPLCAAAQGDPPCPFPTFSLALAAFPGAHWSALLPNAPLRRWHLIEPVPGPVLTVARLSIDERIMHYLAGISHLDERLAAVVRPIESVHANELFPSHAALAARIAATWSRVPSNRHAPVVQLCGDPLDCRPIAASVARALGLHDAIIDAALLPSSTNELEFFLRLLKRESRLTGIGVLLLEFEDTDPPSAAAEPRSHAVAWLAEQLDGFVLLCGRERRGITLRPSVAFDVSHPLLDEQREAWRMALGIAEVSGDGEAEAIDAICAQFNLPFTTIRSIAAETFAVANAGPGAEKAISPLWELCRVRLRARLDSLAQRIQSASTWDDLILPDGETKVLRAIAAQLRRRVIVYEDWGFAAKSSRGLGISALFAGPSGTGKTMAAEVLADELCLDLYRIDLSAVVSKYIGETEKNLRRVFDAAEESGAILLFDEADALFGKRSEVKDSHDRYANIEVSYLLQRMEAYRGLAILTTNMKSALDPAFLRRIRFIVQFPFPDETERAAIWQRVFPASTPTDGLDWARLAKLRVTGGIIRNIALNAAFLAADAREPVRMMHLMAAARSEYAKMERPLTAAEMGG
jgi:hypothetical protein